MIIIAFAHHRVWQFSPGAPHPAPRPTMQRRSPCPRGSSCAAQTRLHSCEYTPCENGNKRRRGATWKSLSETVLVVHPYLPLNYPDVKRESAREGNASNVREGCACSCSNPSKKWYRSERACPQVSLCECWKTVRVTWLLGGGRISASVSSHRTPVHVAGRSCSRRWQPRGHKRYRERDTERDTAPHNAERATLDSTHTHTRPRVRFGIQTSV